MKGEANENLEEESGRANPSFVDQIIKEDNIILEVEDNE